MRRDPVLGAEPLELVHTNPDSIGSPKEFKKIHFNSDLSSRRIEPFLAESGEFERGSVPHDISWSVRLINRTNLVLS